MTQDEIIDMAKEAGVIDDEGVANPYFEGCHIYEQIEAFAKLVAAKERETCAKLCEKQMEDSPWFIEAAAVIRARSEV